MIVFSGSMASPGVNAFTNPPVINPYVQNFAQSLVSTKNISMLPAAAKRLNIGLVIAITSRMSTSIAKGIFHASRRKSSAKVNAMMMTKVTIIVAIGS